MDDNALRDLLAAALTGDKELEEATVLCQQLMQKVFALTNKVLAKKGLPQVDRMGFMVSVHSPDQLMIRPEGNICEGPLTKQ